MPSYTLKLNRENIDVEITRAFGKSDLVRRAADNQFSQVFKIAKNRMLTEFDRHPVTAELIAGPRAVNISNTLGGYGNLFSFIGFHSGARPTAALRDLISVATTYRQTVYRNRAWYFRLETPSKDAIAQVTPMEWTTESWAINIEKTAGISGIGAYIFKRWSGPNSRSGMGIQAGGTSPYEYQEEANFTPIPYMTEILANFRERINNKI